MALFKSIKLLSVRTDTEYVRNCPYCEIRTQVIKVGEFTKGEFAYTLHELMAVLKK